MNENQGVFMDVAVIDLFYFCANFCRSFNTGMYNRSNSVIHFM